MNKIKKFLATLFLVIVCFAFGIISTILIQFLGFKTIVTILTAFSLIILSLGLTTGIILGIQWSIGILWPPKYK